MRIHDGHLLEVLPTASRAERGGKGGAKALGWSGTSYTQPLPIHHDHAHHNRASREEIKGRGGFREHQAKDQINRRSAFMTLMFLRKAIQYL